jgi:hypothetical protein
MNKSELKDFTIDDNRKLLLKSQKAGIERAENITPVVGHVFSEEIPREFGERWANSFSRVRDRLIEGHEDNASDLVSFAVKYFEYSRCKEAAYFTGLISVRGVEDNDRMRSHGTPDGYADSEGWAWTFFNVASEIYQPDELLNKTPFTEYPASISLLQAIALYWFFYAEKLHREGDDRAMDILFESSYATVLAEFLFGWKEGAKYDGGSSAISERARTAANARHKENHQMKSEALEWYEKNKNKYRSKDQAAEVIARTVVPVAFRTARDWIKGR